MSTSVAPLRLRGILRARERGFQLETHEGDVWRVQGADPFADLVDRQVVVEAYRRAPNQLDILWAGPAA